MRFTLNWKCWNVETYFSKPCKSFIMRHNVLPDWESFYNFFGCIFVSTRGQRVTGDAVVWNHNPLISSLMGTYGTDNKYVIESHFLEHLNNTRYESWYRNILFIWRMYVLHLKPKPNHQPCSNLQFVKNMC